MHSDQIITDILVDLWANEPRPHCKQSSADNLLPGANQQQLAGLFTSTEASACAVLRSAATGLSMLHGLGSCESLQQCMHLEVLKGVWRAAGDLEHCMELW